MNPKLWKHMKTGKLYQVLYNSVINATNAQDGQKMVIYQNDDGLIFAREEKEFYEKFELVEE